MLYSVIQESLGFDHTQLLDYVFAISRQYLRSYFGKVDLRVSKRSN